MLGVGSLRARNRAGMTTLEWLLLTAAMAALVATAVVVVQSVVRDVGVDAGSFSARFRAARVAADSLTREWRGHHPASQYEADALNRRYGERCARLGITFADTEALPRWKPGVLAGGGGWFEVHKLPVCSLQNIRGERERFRPFQTVPDESSSGMGLPRPQVE
ncbi:MAG: hypothetical protein F4155_14125 [Acidimicrobiales bacterium]|nr:hypothetical protein [Acidimicrobiales bacterium]MYH75920.1 hypothetical protein [Acidimicrobiales bacterium]MYK71438.1 hypothetical protein [Acidimicrobiales bacterium]